MKVSEEAREAAASFIEAYWPGHGRMNDLAQSIRAGDNGGAFISAFACFEDQLWERAAVIAESYGAGHTARKEQAQHIAAALRAQKESI